MNKRTEKEELGLKPVIINYLLHWKLILGTAAVGLVLAVLYLLLFPRTYETTARVQIEDANNPLTATSASAMLGEATGLMKSFGLGAVGSGTVVIEDEVAHFLSNELLSQTAWELGLYADYTKPYTLGYRMYGEKPLVLRCDSAEMFRLENYLNFDVSVKPGDVQITAEVIGKGLKKKFRFQGLPATVLLPVGHFTFDYTDIGRQEGSFRTEVSVSPLTGVAAKMVKDLDIEELSNASKYIEFTTTDYEQQRSRDIFNTLVRLYNRQETAYTKDLCQKADNYLARRILNVREQLDQVEQNIEKFKTKQGITVAEMDVQYYAEYMKDLQGMLISAETQTYMLKMLDAFVKDTANRYKLAPILTTAGTSTTTSSGTSTAGIQTDLSPLMTYNQALIDRERLIKNSSVNNPMVQTLNAQIDKLRENVYQMIDNSYQSLHQTIDDLKGREQKLRDRMGEVPAQEKVYVEYTRQQDILQAVYLLLLQKREEILLSIGQPTDKARFIDKAFTNPKPLQPRKLYAAIGLFVFTLLVSVGWIFCRKQFLSIRQGFIERVEDEKLEIESEA